jgi:hypothetical protein
MGQVKTTIVLGSEFDNEEAKVIADEVLSYIVERSKSGKGKDGKAFPAYSKSYINSLDFKIAGKKASKIDLTLSGEMLDSLKVLMANKNKIVIGYEKGDPVNNKAEGNILGSYGGEPNPKKARNFLELSGKELTKIIEQLDILPADVQQSISRASNDSAQRMIDNLKFEIDEEESA